MVIERNARSFGLQFRVVPAPRGLKVAFADEADAGDGVERDGRVGGHEHGAARTEAEGELSKFGQFAGDRILHVFYSGFLKEEIEVMFDIA